VCPASLLLRAAYQAGDFVLRRPLLFGNRLGVGVQSDPAGRMPEQLLNNLDVSAARAQERCTGVSERMPPDPLGYANVSRDLTDSIAHERLSPIWLSTVAVRTGEDPVVSGLVLGVKPPCTESSREKRVERNWFLRCFRSGSVTNLITGKVLRELTHSSDFAGAFGRRE